MRRPASLALLFVLALPASAHAERQQERLDRGVVAVNQGEGRVFVGWRMIGTDPVDVAFNLYRQVEGGPVEQINEAPLDKVTWFVDESAPLDHATSYYVAPVGDPAPIPNGLAASAASLPAPAPSTPSPPTPGRSPASSSP